MSSITGTDGPDTITSGFVSPGVGGGAPGAGADSIDGGAGVDLLEGGAGDDTYRVDRLSDQVLEAVGGGRDTVLASGSYVLAPRQEIEVLEMLGGTSLVLGVGNAFDNTIIGGFGSSVLDGGDGDDSLVGRGAADVLIGGAGNDTLFDEGAGDQMFGGPGNDTYVLAGSAAIVDDGGIDMILLATVIATEGLFVLPPDIENLMQATDVAITALGNALANRITGSPLSDDLRGLDGDDTLLGGEASDRLVGGQGNDSLDGGPNGSGDIMLGGTGHDRYAVDSAGDQVIERAGEGNDTITATVSCTLPDFVEHLILAGTAAIAGTGNADANRVTGNAAANLLDGSGGDDTLSGGKGDDTLLGGAGADLLIGAKGRDVFRYLAPIGPPDTIKGYNGRQDGIEVSAAGFGADLVAGMTMAEEGRFTANATGTPEGFLAQFILNTTTGLLRWDADGINDTSAVDLAFLPGAKGLTGAEILVIA